MNEYPIYHPYHEPWTSSSKIITQSSLLAIADRPANVPPLTNQPATVQSTANHLTALPGPPLAIDQPAVSLPLTDRFPVSTGLEHKSSDQKKEETVNIFGSQEVGRLHMHQLWVVVIVDCQSNQLEGCWFH